MEELNGEGLGWVLPLGALPHPLIHTLRRWGSGPAGQHGTLSTAEHPRRPREVEGGWGGPGRPCRLPCAPQTRQRYRSAIHSQPKSTGMRRHLSAQPGDSRRPSSGAPAPPRPALRLPATSGAPPLPFCALCPLLALCALGPAPLGLQRSRASRPLGVGEGERVDFPQGL